MDFITRLPKFEGKRVIMVIIDRLTKYAYFFALSHPFKANTITTAFMEIVYKLHGSPNIIVSDTHPIFTGHFLIELFSCLGTQLAHSSYYHPQFDGQTEIVKKCLEVQLRFFDSNKKQNGSNGYSWKNGGITLPFILQKNDTIYGTLWIPPSFHHFFSK